MKKLPIVNAWVDRNTNAIFIVWHDERGKRVKKIQWGLPYFYLDKKRIDARKFLKNSLSKYVNSVFDCDSYWKVYCHNIDLMIVIRDAFRQSMIQTYEADVPFIYRWMIDNGYYIDKSCYRPLFYDIETDDTHRGIKLGVYPILSIATIDPYTGKTNYFLNRDRHSKLEEKRMLQEFANFVENYNILSAFYGSGFDDPYIIMAMKKHGIIFNPKHFQWVDFQVLDKIYHRRLYYSLEYIETEEGYDLPKLELCGKVVDVYDKDKSLLKQYNIRDVEIMYKHEQENHLLQHVFNYSEMSGTFLQHIMPDPNFRNNFKMTRMFDNLFFRFMKEQPEYFYPLPTKGRSDQVVSLKGGWVNIEKTGICKFVIGLDFQNMYNKIMQSFNIDLSTLTDDPNNSIYIPMSEENIGKKIYFTKNKRGVAPLILQNLEKSRIFYKDKRDTYPYKSKEYNINDSIQANYKGVILSAYGLIGSSYSRFIKYEICNSVTLIGRYLSQQTNNLIKSLQYSTIYSDTDSCYIELDSLITATTREGQIEQCTYHANKILKECAKLYDTILEEAGVPEEWRCIKLEFENIYDIILFTGTDEQKKKKRYVGNLIYQDGKPCQQVVWKGLEKVRRDWCNYTKIVQVEMVENYIFKQKSSEDIRKYILEQKEIVTNQKLSVDDVILVKSITKPLEQYGKNGKNIPPHIRVVLDMKEQNKEMLDRKVRYVVTSDEPIIAVYYKDFKEYDPIYYWNKQVYPPIMRLLQSAFPNELWEEYLIPKKEAKEKRKTRNNQLLDRFMG